MNGLLPRCDCNGLKNWTPNGSFFGPSHESRLYLCSSCHRVLHLEYIEGWHVGFVFLPDQQDAFGKFFEESFVVQARAFGETKRALYEKCYEALITAWGFDPARGCEPHRRGDLPSKANGDFVLEYRDNDLNTLDIDADAFLVAVQQLRALCQTIVRPPDPIGLPDHITAFVCRTMRWIHVKAEDTANKALPPDPLRIHHDEKFANIFGAVVLATGVSFTPVEIPNLYWSDPSKSEPWFTFDILGSKFTVGPRKRVISINVVFPSPRDVGAISQAAEEDDVTYFVNNSTLNGYYGISSFSIHAWTRDKAVEYLKLAVIAAVENIR